MKLNLTSMMMTMMILLSTTITLSSNNMMMAWMSMEMNLIVFLPMMKKSNKMNEQSMKYLIIQSISSTMIMTAMIMNSISEYPLSESILIMSGLLTKMGIMPFHLWLPPMMQMSSWNICMMMSTIQKITPTIMINQMTTMKLMTPSLILSMTISPIVGMTQTSMKKMLAYSSISNSPMMIMATFNSKLQMMLLFTSYSTMTILLMKTLKEMNIMYINQMNNKSQKTKMIISLAMISMSGMPPTTGFMMKWMIMQTSVNYSILLTSAMLFSSLISTFMYLNSNLPFMMMTMKKKQKKEKKNNKFLIILANLIGIPMAMLTNLS
nr:NADH dehydrogenase subunit 2 [Dichoptera sp. WW-2021a]